MRPCLDLSGFSHFRYDEADVVENGRCVSVQCTLVSYLVVTPCVKIFVGKLVTRIAYHFANEV